MKMLLSAIISSWSVVAGTLYRVCPRRPDPSPALRCGDRPANGRRPARLGGPGRRVPGSGGWRVSDGVLNVEIESSRKPTDLTGTSASPGPGDLQAPPEPARPVDDPAERAMILPTLEGGSSPLWECPDCDYTTVGTVDEPLGDGTCPHHPRRLLRRGRQTPTQ